MFENSFSIKLVLIYSKNPSRVYKNKYTPGGSPFPRVKDQFYLVKKTWIAVFSPIIPDKKSSLPNHDDAGWLCILRTTKNFLSVRIRFESSQQEQANSNSFENKPLHCSSESL
jgi:hypothetical protein